MTNPHDDRLNRLERWLERYGEDAQVVESIRCALMDLRRDCLDRDLRYRARKLPTISRETREAADALRDLANIVGVGLDDLEG